MSNERIFLTIWAIGLLLTWPPWFWWSIRSRRASGYPIVPQAPVGAIYVEKKASGREHGKFGGASNCLLVAITTDQFMVAPQFPFNLVAPRGILGLEHTVPKTSITASLQRDWLGANVRISIANMEKAVVMDLKLRRAEEFLATLAR